MATSVIFGPAAKGKLRQSLQISNGDWSILWSSRFSIGVYITIVLILIAVGVRAVVIRRGARTAV